MIVGSGKLVLTSKVMGLSILADQLPDRYSLIVLCMLIK